MAPARLHKQEDTENDFYGNLINSIEALAIRHATLLFILAIVLLLALFVTLIFALCGVSAVESGTVYNGFDKII